MRHSGYAAKQVKEWENVVFTRVRDNESHKWALIFFCVCDMSLILPFFYKGELSDLKNIEDSLSRTFMRSGIFG